MPATTKTLHGMLPTVLLAACLCGLSAGGCDEERLDSDHPGWNNPSCRSCHTDAHHDGMTIGECTECHGDNGSPPQNPHTDCGGSEAGGSGCHEGEHGDAADGFPEGSCAPCHS